MSKYTKGSKLWYEREASEEEFLNWYKTQDQPKYEKPSVTVDLIGLRFNVTTDKIQILLVQRVANPYRNHWALPGGFIEPNETTYDAVKREVKEETGLSIDEQRIQLLPLVSTPNRDPRMWVMTNPNIILFTPEDDLKLKAGDDALKAKFFDIEMDKDDSVVIDGLKQSDLAFDHYDIIKSAMLKLRVELDRRRFENVFPLLPKEFTLVQALALFKSINIKRYAKYISSSVKKSLGSKAVQVGTATIDGVGKPKMLYKLK